MQQERFPQSSLSEAWEKDVRASLERHKQKIADLTKELEQESLYVEYLERLLSDVEKYRENGSDPALLVDAATPTINRLSTNEQDGTNAQNADSKSCDEVSGLLFYSFFRIYFFMNYKKCTQFVLIPPN